MAFSNATFTKGNMEKTLSKIENILSKNGIDYKTMANVDQTHCKPSMWSKVLNRDKFVYKEYHNLQ